ncbi:MAG: hypothetical protein QOJ29_2577 [Thermoleophilaceae bacterium]|nr:hypothetical protein [Thermoleophilaceae bacterium]
MDELLVALQNVSYPATRQDLIDALARGDATLARLEALPKERYDSADEVERDLVMRRAESNPSLVAITIEPCPECGFPRVPGKPHSCVEEKARFAESANAVTDEFDIMDAERGDLS